MIWECKQCRVRVHGPQYPQSDDPCRVCPACTLRLGEIVYRKLRQRSGKAAKANPRLQYMWRGIDLRRELKRLVKFCPPHVQARPPSLDLIHLSIQPPSNVVAYANFERNRVEVRLWPMCPLGWPLASVVHELAHFSLRDNHHGERFRSAMVELVRDGYGVEPAYPSGRSIMDLDESVEDALTTWCSERYRDECLIAQLSMWLKRERRRRKGKEK